jgi:hypothetical protein
MWYLKPTVSSDNVPVRSARETCSDQTSEKSTTTTSQLIKTGIRNVPSNLQLGSTSSHGMKSGPTYEQLRRQSSYDEFRHTWKDSEPKVHHQWTKPAGLVRCVSNETVQMNETSCHSSGGTSEMSSDTRRTRSPSLLQDMLWSSQKSCDGDPSSSVWRSITNISDLNGEPGLAPTLSRAQKMARARQRDKQREQEHQREVGILMNIVEWLFPVPVVDSKNRSFRYY